MKKNKVALIILDGWGLAQSWGGNAITLANTPNFDLLKKNYPFTTLFASGEDVGLPYGEPGNSEVGHLNIGSGHAVSQGLSAINEMITSGNFKENKALNSLIDKIKDRKASLHLLGLVSDGGIHSHINHLFSLLDLAKNKGVKEVCIHFISDGRDSVTTSGIKYLKQLASKIEEFGVGKIVSISGRYFAMDRDNNWDRIEKAYDAILGLSTKKFNNPKDMFLQSYSAGITDEFIVPACSKKYSGIKDGDGIVFFNYRSDRAREMSNALVAKSFNGFKRKRVLENVSLATFGSYQENLPVLVAFESTQVANPLANVLEKNELTHFHIAETEKYAHVTYFFNGGSEEVFPLEKRVLIPSFKVKTHDLRPEMRAVDIADNIIDLADNYDFTVANFANPDMVGHTGNFEATVKAVEKVDECLGKIAKKFLLSGMTFMITADHGNAEEMIDQITGLANTEHTNNPVPFILAGKKYIGHALRDEGRLSDIAPTIIDLLEIEKPNNMKGKSLFRM